MTRKWKHKRGRDRSHSYWSRTHGPRGTTHGTYGRRPWLWMVSRKGFLYPAGCRGSFSRQPRSSVLGVSTRGLNIGEGGCRGDPPGSQEASWRGLGWGRARDPPGLLVVAPLRCLGYSGSFRVADFYLIFPDFLEHF